MAQISTISYNPGHVDVKTIHSAITASVANTAAVSYPCAGAKAIMLSITGESIAGRTGTLTFEGSIDGTTFVAYNVLIDNVVEADTKTIARIASKARTADGTDLIIVDPAFLGALRRFRIPFAIAGGSGNFTVKASICY